MTTIGWLVLIAAGVSLAIITSVAALAMVAKAHGVLPVPHAAAPLQSPLTPSDYWITGLAALAAFALPFVFLRPQRA